MSITPPARKTAPAITKPSAIQSTAGIRAPRSACTPTPGLPSAFITTTVHDPPCGSHFSVRTPGPVEEAAQNCCAPGADGGLPPPTDFTLSPKKSEMTVRFTPPRYLSTALERPMPTKG